MKRGDRCLAAAAVGGCAPPLKHVSSISAKDAAEYSEDPPLPCDLAIDSQAVRSLLCWQSCCRLPHLR